MRPSLGCPHSVAILGMDDLRKFANWWSLLGAAGAVITAASINQQNPAGMFFGVGLLLVGVGEWICRPQRTEITRGPDPGTYIPTEATHGSQSLSASSLISLGWPPWDMRSI